jgi:MFS family permease
VTRLKAISGRTFQSLRVRNYRLYFTGQIISVSGTWMQSVAQAWLVLKLTGSGVALGFTTALQFTPMLLLGAWGGLMADRFDKRKLLIGTQVGAGILALFLGILTASGVIRLWMVFAFAVAFGVVTMLDNPARQAFVVEMVGPDELTNAVGLNSATFNAARIVGPAIAGVLIATVGIAPCFLINAVSYIAVIVALGAMRSSELHRGEPLPRKKGQLREGFQYVWSTPALRGPLLLMAVVGTLAFNFQVILPLVAKYTFHGDAGTYGAISSLMGAGTLVGALVAAAGRRSTPRFLAAAAVVFGVLILVAAGAPTLALEMVAVVPMGFASMTFVVTANSTLQLNSSREMRGRVMALYAVVFLGSTPIGGPIVGWVSQHYGARAALALGGVATLVAGLVSLIGLRRVPAPPGSPAAVGAGDAVEGWADGAPGGAAGRDPGRDRGDARRLARSGQSASG